MAEAIAAWRLIVAIALSPVFVQASPLDTVTYDLLSTQFDMKLDPKNLTWSGRSRELRRFHVDGTKGLDSGLFDVYESSILKITDVRVRIRREGKGWRDAELDVAKATPWDGFPEFKDEIVRIHRIRGLRIGDDVEVSIEQNHLVAWEIPGYSFGQRDPIHQEIYEVRMPSSIVPATSVRPGLLRRTTPRASVSTAANHLVLRWEATDESGMGELEPGAPAVSRLLPSVRVIASGFVDAHGDTIPVRRSWRDFAAWYEGRVRPLLDVDPDIQAWVDEQHAAVSSRDELIQRVFAQVQQRVRYLAISVGEGGWVPHAAPATYKAGYGDCKDMSTLLVGTLRALGIPAHLALVQARGSGEVDPSFPYCLQFNHCVAWVPDPRGDWWLDATGGDLRAGEVTTFITENPALVLAADSTRFLQPVPRDRAGNVQLESFELGADRGGRAGLRFQFRWCGAMAPEIRHAIEVVEAKKRLDYTTTVLHERFDNVAQVELDPPQSDVGRTTLTGRCTVLSPLQESGGEWLLRRGVVRLVLPKVFGTRRLPFSAGPARRVITEVALPMPAQLHPDSLEVTREENFAVFHLRTVARGARWVCTRRLEWKSEIVSVPELPLLFEFTREVQRTNDDVVSIAGR